LTDYNEAIRRKSGNADFYRARADVLMNLKKFKSAIADYDKVIQLVGNDDAGVCYSERGEVYMQLGDYASAVNDFTQAIQMNASMKSHGVEPSDDFFYMRGKAYMGQKNYAAAVKDFSDAIKLDNRNYEYYDSRRQAYEKMGNTTAAKKDSDKIKALKTSKKKK